MFNINSNNICKNKMKDARFRTKEKQDARFNINSNKICHSMMMRGSRGRRQGLSATATTQFGVRGTKLDVCSTQSTKWSITC